MLRINCFLLLHCLFEASKDALRAKRGVSQVSISALRTKRFDGLFQLGASLCITSRDLAWS